STASRALAQCFLRLSRGLGIVTMVFVIVATFVFPMSSIPAPHVPPNKRGRGLLVLALDVIRSAEGDVVAVSHVTVVQVCVDTHPLAAPDDPHIPFIGVVDGQP